MSEHGPSLQSLIEACFAAPRDESAMARLDAELRPYLLAVLASVNRRGADHVEDAYQAAFVKFIQLFRAGPRPGINYEAYFVAIAKNCFFDLAARDRRIVPIDEVLESEFEIPSRDEMKRTEARLMVWQAPERMDRPCQFLLERHFLSGFEQQELAAEDGISLEAVRMRLQRCRDKLRRLLNGG